MEPPVIRIRPPVSGPARPTVHIDTTPDDAPADADDGAIRDGADPIDSLDPSPARSGRRGLAIAGLVVASLALAGVVALWTTRNDTSPAAAPVTSGPSTTLERPPALSAEVFDLIAPSTVVVTVAEGASADSNGDATGGIGTGVVANADGLVITALHVVDGASRIELGFADGSVVTAQIVDRIPDSDLALLMPDAPPGLIVPAVFASADALSVGDEAFVVGNPIGLTASMSAGVISGFERSFSNPETGTVIDGLIQFDAAVNPGNSGGPLVNRRGEVVGIVTALANPSGDDSFSGISFAVTLDSGGGGIAPGQ